MDVQLPRNDVKQSITEVRPCRLPQSPTSHQRSHLPKSRHRLLPRAVVLESLLNHGINLIRHLAHVAYHLALQQMDLLLLTLAACLAMAASLAACLAACPL